MIGWSSQAAAQPANRVVVLTLSGVVGPGSVDYVHRGLGKGVEIDAQLVVLKMDTPGGLDLSMHAIITRILASPIPVAGFVAPNGARAASSGTCILHVSHIAAMAPASNLGVVAPVAIGPDSEPHEPAATKGKNEGDRERGCGAQSTATTMTRNLTSDAAAYVRGLAQSRGRNAEWADRAVRVAVSLSAQEALESKVIDLIATDVSQLHEQLDGRKVSILGQERQLAAGAAEIVEYQAD